MNAESMIGMSLEYALKRLCVEEPEAMCHIGSRSAFFLIGTPAECEELLDQISAECHEEFQKYVDALKDRLKYIKKKDKALDKRLADGRISLVEFANELTQISGEKIRTTEYLRSGSKKADSFVSMRKREVKDCYVKEFEPGIAIIVSGDEVGKYWSVDEWVRERRETKNEENGNG